MSTGPLARLVVVVVVVLAATACSGADTEDPAAFCDAMAGATEATSAVSALDLDDAASVDAAIAMLRVITALAPSAIVEDAAAVAEVYTRVLETLVVTASGARPEALQGFQDDFDSVSAAASRVQRYTEDTCAVQFAPLPLPTPSPTPLDIVD